MTPKQLNESLRGQLFSDCLPDWFIQRFNGSEDENYGIISDVQPFHKGPHSLENWKMLLEMNDTMDDFQDLLDDGAKYLVGNEQIVTVVYDSIHAFKYVALVFDRGDRLIHQFLAVSTPSLLPGGDQLCPGDDGYPGFFSFYAHVVR